MININLKNASVNELIDKIKKYEWIKCEDGGYTKHYSLNSSKKWELIGVEDDNNYYELTSIPDDKMNDYKVNLKTGKIWSNLSNRFLKTKPNRIGYHYTTLNGVPIAVHVVVAMAKYQINRREWLKKGMSVDHIDRNKSNQSASNLRVIPHHKQFESEKVRRKMGKGIKLTADEIRKIKMIAEILKIKGKYKTSDVCHVFAKLYKKDYTTIFNVLKGNTHTNIDLTVEQKAELAKLELGI